MDAVTLARAMGCPQVTAESYLADMNAAMAAAGCTTVRRAAMWCAQIGHESAGLFYMQEIASGQAYEGRRDLGNVQPGDGKRFKGRGPIQLTGRHNYDEFGRWCRARGLVERADQFLRDPASVATSRWGFLAAAWYWTVARPRLNAQADAGDLVAATRSINGGTNGIDDRRKRWESCLRLGTALLPDTPARPAPPEEDPVTVWAYDIPDRYGPNLPAMDAGAALSWATAHAAHARDAARQATAVATRAEATGLKTLDLIGELAAKLDDLIDRAPASGGGAEPAHDLAGIVARLADLDLRLRALESPQEGP